MNRRSTVSFALALVLAVGAAASRPLRAQDGAAVQRSAERSREIHEAIAARGIPIASVRCRDGRFELALGPACTAAQRAEAEALRDAIAARAPTTITVTSLEDALVVLRFEPCNDSANQVVRARYQQLRAAAQGQ